jgi:hypothetical protein
MTRILATILIFAIAAEANAMDLIRQDKPVASIVTTELLGDAKSPLAMAVSDLNYHLQQMSGVELPVKVGNGQGPAIVLGKLSGAVPSKTTASREAFRLVVKADQVLIGGESDDAVALGIYELLRRLGCDWVMPGPLGEVIPKRSTVSLEPMDVDRAPDFLMRRLWYRGSSKLNTPSDQAEFQQWLRRQHGGQWEHPAADCAGHAWGSFIRKHQAEFEKDPSMYALTRGPDGALQRRGPQVESTHPRVIELFVQDIKAEYQKQIAAGKWTKDTAAGFAVGPSDGLGYSESAEAAAASAGRTDPVVGAPDQTDLLVLMANKILAEVHKEYPNAYAGFYSYSVHSDYPARYQPDSKLAQIFVPINFSRFHSVVDDYSRTQGYYRGVVEQWAKLAKQQGNPLLYRGYNWNLAENGLPYSKARIWGEELPFYHRNGFVGLNVESTKAWAVNGASDYIFMRLAFDSSQDWRLLLKDYCQKSYGHGSAAMEQYLLAVIDRQRDAKQEAGSYHAFPLIYDKAWVAAQRMVIEQALASAEQPAEKQRISAALNVLKQLDLFLDFHAAAKRFDFHAAKAGYDAMLSNWQALYDMNTQLAAKEAPQYLKRYLEKFVAEGLQYSQGQYRVAYQIPDELTTVFDPQHAGHLMRYQDPQIDDSKFLKTKTYSTTWDAQGLGAMRTEAVWYRIPFTLPAEAKGKPVGLFIGAVDDEARVWINGQAVGTSGRGFSRPFEFDLTDGIKYDGQNLLAVQVIRNSAANEIGVGGMFRPSFIFTGPRLATKAPRPLELRRVLPGGEEGEAEK